MRLEGWYNPYLQQDEKGDFVNSRVYEAGADAMLKAILKYMEEKSLFSMAHGQPIYSMSLKDWRVLSGPLYTPEDYVEVHNKA